MKAKPTHWIARVALIAAVYATLTYLAGLAGIAYEQVQFRFSEALCILAAFTPAAIPGLTLGCLLANLASPLGPIDWICGTVATLLAALVTYALRRWKWLTPLPAVLFNAVIVGAELAYLFGADAFWPAFGINALWVGLGELAMCYGLGLPLYYLIDRTPPLRSFLTGVKEQ